MRGTRAWVAVTALALAGGLAAGLTLAAVMQTARPAQGASAPAATQSPPTPAQPASGTQAPVTLGQAVKMVEARYKGRVVRATTHREGGQVLYVMRLLDRHGRVFTVRVDAVTGKVL